ncbi:hypothetical protein MMC14_004592 [Varicellaria rhodocarpa]|nr:hypothetical protein [Varicellaria rhodocarpa]
MSLSQQAIRVDPNNPLPSPRRGSQSAQKSPFLDETTNPENGLGRTTSRKRRVSGQGNTRNTGRTPRSDDLPPAPDAPRAPPVSYRNPYDNDPAPPENKVSSKSFAARARTIPDKVDPRLANSLITGNVPAVNNKRHARRGSVHNAPKGQSPQAQEMSPSGLESNLDSAQPDSMLDGATSRNIQNLVQAPVQQKAKPFEAPLFPNADPSSAPSSSRRVSTEVAGSPSKWATDRSPLQKLEVKLIDKSKEEKRARVQEAEQLLRELKAAKSDRKASLAPNLPKERTMSKRERTRNGEGGSTKNAARDRLDGEDPMNSSSVRQGMRNVERELSRQDYDGGLEQRRNVSEPVASGQMNGNSSLTTHRAASQGHSWQGKRRSVGVADSNSFDRRDISLQKNETDNQTVNISGRTNFTDENHDQDSLPHRDYQVVDTSSPEHRRSLPQQSRPSRSQEFNDTPSRQVPSQQMHLYAIKAERTSGHTTAAADKDQKDPIPGRTARTYESGPKYETVPQTASGIDARQKIGFGSRADEAVEHNPGRQHHFSNLLHRDHHEERRSVVSQNSGLKHSDEWRQGGVAHLTLADRLADPEGSEDKHALWEGKSSGQRQNVGARNGEASSFGTERGFEDSNGIVPFSLSPIPEEPPSPITEETLQSGLDDIRAKHDIDYNETLLVLGRNRPWLRPPNIMKNVRFSDNNV